MPIATAVTKKSIPYGKHTLTLQTGEIARQAGGAVLASLDDSVVLVTVVAAKQAKPGQDFGTQGSMTSVVPRSRNPRIHSSPARYIHPAEPVYQVQPPRPTCDGSA